MFVLKLNAFSSILKLRWAFVWCCQFSSWSPEHSSFGCIVHIALHCQILYSIILGLVHILIIIRKLKSVRQRKYGKLVIGSHIVDNSSNHDMFINEGLVIWLVVWFSLGRRSVLQNGATGRFLQRLVGQSGNPLLQSTTLSTLPCKKYFSLFATTLHLGT